MEQFFLPGDFTQAAKELDCYYDLFNEVHALILKGEFEKAIAHNYNMVRSLEELRDLREEKQAHDQAEFILRQLEAQQENMIVTIVRKYAE